MTITKAFDILEIFLKRPGEYGIVELASLCHLSISTTHRIVSILVKRGFLNQREKRGKYTLGFKLLEYSAKIKGTVKIRDLVLPYLQTLAEQVGESVNLAILDVDSAIYIDHIESNKTLRTFTAEGNRVPLYCTGVGKVFLAYMKEDEVKSLVKSMPRCTDNTITTLSRLLAELKIIKQDAIAIDNGEMEIGVRCVAAPIIDWNGKVAAAISVSVPSARLTDANINSLKSIVKNCSLQISRSLGHA
jgi:IclR family transcriptional regulator, KDG regulon repressor